ncbi:MAG: hypothetical protein ACPKOI_03470 [Pleomorphochaeta sp.]
MEKYIDLNGREKQITATIKLSDTTFQIKRVVIAIRVLYSNHLIKMGTLFKKVGEIKEDDQKALNEINISIDEFNKEKEEVYDKILKLLLEKNGYKFNKTWWNENADELDIRNFIEECLNKDTNTRSKKKVLK